MSTIVTTSVVSTLSIVAYASLAVVSVVLFLALLVQKEIASGVIGVRASRWSHALNIALAPLFIVFIIAVVSRLANVAP